MHCVSSIRSSPPAWTWPPIQRATPSTPSRRASEAATKALHSLGTSGGSREGVDAWYDLIALFYRLQNLFTLFAIKDEHRQKVVRILQGNLYMPETLGRAREMISLMEAAYERIMAQPTNLLRPGALAAYMNGELVPK